MFNKIKDFLKRKFNKDYRDAIKVLDKLCGKQITRRLPPG